MESQRSHYSHWRSDGTCSYCGSISSQMLFEAIQSGTEIGPTDKNYKIYCDVPDPLVGNDRVVGVANQYPGNGWVPGDPEILQQSGFYADHKWMKIEPRKATKFGKFYFQHFTEEEKHKFIDLVNQRKINIGYPGHFYVLPYFMVKVGVR
jgi:hypothetical protein